MDAELIFLIVLFVLFLLAAFSPSWLSRLRDAEEKGLTPLIEERCITRRDSAQGTSLGRNLFLWRVSLYPEFLILSLFRRERIPLDEIDTVELKNFQDSKEIWINRHGETAGEFISVRSERAEKFLEAFAQCGVRIIARRQGAEPR